MMLFYVLFPFNLRLAGSCSTERQCVSLTVNVSRPPQRPAAYFHLPSRRLFNGTKCARGLPRCLSTHIFFQLEAGKQHLLIGWCWEITKPQSNSWKQTIRGKDLTVLKKKSLVIIFFLLLEASLINVCMLLFFVFFLQVFDQLNGQTSCTTLVGTKLLAFLHRVNSLCR